ncbi:MAG: PIN domain-containing protein [Candidatus Gracilibacteria bacterium]
MNIDFSSTYEITEDDRVFIDTNILIFLFSPDFVSSHDYQVDKYSTIYAILLEKNCKLYVNSHVISEFINKCLRIDFDRNIQNEARTKLFKNDYRNTQRYRETLSIVLRELKKFLDLNVFQINDNFSNFQIFDEYNSNVESDFNDLVIARNVIDNRLKLLSDDRDFSNYDEINTNWYIS